MVYHRGGHWNHPLIYRDTNAHWRVQEAGVITTRYRAALEAAAAEQLTSEEEGEQNAPPKPPPLEQAKADMSHVDNNSGIGSLHAQDEKEPTHAIAITPGMRTIAIKSGVLAVLSNFYGLSKECPYAFLEEFCRYIDIQPVPAGSTSEDYRLQAIPFILNGDAGVWLSRLPDGSIRTWVEFRMIFLDHFFPASKTSALKREITEARKEYDEPLGQYWDRFQGVDSSVLQAQDGRSPRGFLKNLIQSSKEYSGEANRGEEPGAVLRRHHRIAAALRSRCCSHTGCQRRCSLNRHLPSSSLVVAGKTQHHCRQRRDAAGAAVVTVQFKPPASSVSLARFHAVVSSHHWTAPVRGRYSSHLVRHISKYCLDRTLETSSSLSISSLLSLNLSIRKSQIGKTFSSLTAPPLLLDTRITQCCCSEFVEQPRSAIAVVPLRRRFSSAQPSPLPPLMKSRRVNGVGYVIARLLGFIVGFKSADSGTESRL
ncbi:hypothetical protein SASPL_123344 [Salvia splendens]|uniref:Retrotransposon gag domain-containing protein n=1 Tax=Salvia splendens TaxID=180675 RepID=A0A8X8XPN1_SALSN|nr:hypothetical protein SASPL_123344 [Salvia splendens]